MTDIIDKKLLKFIIVGIINTAVGMAIMFGLYNLAGCGYWLSSAANYILTSILSYFLNRSFTFGHEGNMKKSMLRFAVNIAVCYLIAYGIAKPLAAWAFSWCGRSIQENIAMLAGMCIFTGLNYLGQRFFVFGYGEKYMEYTKTYKKWINSGVLNENEVSELKKMSEGEIKEAFYKMAEFGTAGMRGKMGLGCNRINKYTIRAAAEGLARTLDAGDSVAIAYDTRNNSRNYAVEAACVLAYYDIKSYIFDKYAPVPLLSFAVRKLNCDAGIVITASHNTKEYNGFKVYDNTGCQMIDDFSKQIASNIRPLEDLLNVPFAEKTNELIAYIDNEISDLYISCVLKEKRNKEQMNEALNIVYTPLHGSGRDYVTELLNQAGFSNLNMVKNQADFNGNFPTVKKPNPEDNDALSMAAEMAIKQDSDILIGTDPDCDRIGVGIRAANEIVYLTGNQIGTLIIDYLAGIENIGNRKLITTIVTGEMGPVVAKSYGIEVIRTLTGFKYIGNIMNMISSGEFFMGYEESYGYLTGTHSRDKDAVSTALVICEMAAFYKAQGMTLIDRLSQLYEKYGCYLDSQDSFEFEGIEGKEKISRIMKNLREEGKDEFKELSGECRLMDYSRGIGQLSPADVLKFIFEDGSWIAARPSGTEPKIKFYYCIRGDDMKTAGEFLERIRRTVRAAVDKA